MLSASESGTAEVDAVGLLLTAVNEVDLSASVFHAFLMTATCNGTSDNNDEINLDAYQSIFFCLHAFTIHCLVSSISVPLVLLSTGG